MSFQVGQQVIFGRGRGEQTKGTVVKVNPKSLKVRQDEARNGHPVGTVWTVSPKLVRDAAEPAPTPAPIRRRPCLVNVLTGQRYYGRPDESEDMLFGRLANGLY